MRRGGRSAKADVSLTTRPCPPTPSHGGHVATNGGKTAAGRTETARWGKLDDVLRLAGPDRPHPRTLKLRPNLGIRESWRRWQRSTCHPSSTYNPLFLPHSFSPCRNSPFVTLAAWLRSPLLERSSHLFFTNFFSLPFHLMLTCCSTLECFPRRTGCCAFVCYCKAWFVILSCCTCTRLICCTGILLLVRAVTRHISCVGGVLHSGISDSWFFRR